MTQSPLSLVTQESIDTSSPISDLTIKPQNNPGKMSLNTKKSPEHTTPENEIHSNEQLWELYKPDQLSVVRNFSSLYFDALNFSSNDQYQWMIKNGYPTPDNILIAAESSIEQLAEIADQGDVAVMNLVADKAIAELLSIANKNISDDLDPYMDEDFFQMELLFRKYSTMAAQSGSAFSGYLLARYALELTDINGSDSNSTTAAVKSAFRGLALAKSFGDRYAENRARFLASASGVSIDTFEAYIQYDSFYRSNTIPPCLNDFNNEIMPDVDP